MFIRLFCTALIGLVQSAAYAQSAPQSVHADAPNVYSASQKIEGRYTGPWVTTNRKLDGVLHAQLKQTTRDTWQGRFWGIWQQVPFDYTVEFERVKNPPERPETARVGTARNVDLKVESGATPVAGKAMIDGASYDWIGTLSPEKFNVQFTGSRYEGHLELTRVTVKPPPQ